MSDRDEFDRDEELRALLRAADPSGSLRPVDPQALGAVLDEIADTDLEADSASQRVAGRGRRGPLTWLAGAAAAAVVVTAGAGAVHQVTTGDSGPAAASHQATSSAPTSTSATPSSTGPARPAVSELSVDPGAFDARCAAPTAAMLAALDTAFSGTVTQIDGNQVTVQRTGTFQGPVADAVRITAPSVEFGQLVQAVHFKVGQSYLISAYQGRLAVCGFSGPAKPGLRAIYTEAFPR